MHNQKEVIVFWFFFYPNISKTISSSCSPIPLYKGIDSEMGYSTKPSYKRINENNSEKRDRIFIIAFNL